MREKQNQEDALPPSAGDDAASDYSAESKSDKLAEPDPDLSTPSNQDQMEVHTHGHVHENKKWKEYLFQFIMLFLAITAGFFMENQREHYIEHQRAKIMAASVIEDLKADTLEITSSGNRTLAIAKVADSLMLQLDKPRNLQNDSLVQIYTARLLGYNFFDPQLGTYQQIKSSGALRYFKPEVSLQLTKYETSTNYIQKLSNESMDFRMHVMMPFCMTLENGQFLSATRSKNEYNGTPFLQEPSHAQLQTLYNFALTIKSTYEWYVERMKTHRTNAEELMKTLHDEYVHS